MGLRAKLMSALRPGEGVLSFVAGGLIGRALAPVTPILIALGMRDRSNRFILNIGDEGSTLVQIRGGHIVDAIFAEASSDDGWQALRDTLSSDATATILLVADVLEQMYREDTVPKVGFFDRGKIVQRRLDLTFPNEVLKAALPARRKRGAPQSVLFTALPMSTHLERWIAFLDEFPNPAFGFYMLPLEVVGLAAKLAPPTAGEARKVWRALITQEAASGYRQVFELDGKMIVTRLTQRPTHPLTPDGEAMLIERELRSSISYVKRLGFSDSDRLDVVLLADPAVCRAVDERDLPATTLTVYTPYQAGIMLGLGEVGREDSPFSDVLLGQWIADKRRRFLMLPTGKIIEQLKMRSILRWSVAATAALTLFALYYCGSLIDDYAESGNDIASLEERIAKSKSLIESENNRGTYQDVPLDELSDVATTEGRLEEHQIDLVGLLRKVGDDLGADARVTKITYTIPKATASPQQPQRAGRPPAAANVQAAATPVAYTLDIKVQLDVPDAEANDIEAPGRHARAVLARLSQTFPGMVQAPQIPDASMRNQVIEGNADTKSAAPQAALTAEFVIKRDK